MVVNFQLESIFFIQDVVFDPFVVHAHFVFHPQLVSVDVLKNIELDRVEIELVMGIISLDPRYDLLELFFLGGQGCHPFKLLLDPCNICRTVVNAGKFLRVVRVGPIVNRRMGRFHVVRDY